MQIYKIEICVFTEHNERQEIKSFLSRILQNNATSFDLAQQIPHTTGK